MMAVTACPAASMLSKIPKSVRVPSANGRSLTSISVAMPKQPSEPTKRLTRSSAPSGTRPAPPNWTTRPSAMTTVSPVTYRWVTPYLRQCGPPEFSATFPPSVHVL